MKDDVKRRLRRAGLTALAVSGGIFLIVTMWRPRCIILRATGLYCPGCGMQRMLWAAFRGDFAAAFGYNPLLFVLTPMLLVYLAAEFVRYVRGKPPLLLRRGVQFAFGAVLVCAGVFMALRNMPAFAFLAP